MRNCRTILLVCAAIAGATLLSGCQKIGVKNPYAGQAIRFAAGSRGTQSTKTVYGGDYEKENTVYQALNWKVNDMITIASEQAEVQNVGGNASDYKVTKVVEGVPSTATVVNADVNGLMWSENESVTNYQFYAAYPAVGTERTNLTLTAKGAFSATIPSTQSLVGQPEEKTDPKGDASISYKVYAPEMVFAYMTAAASIKIDENTTTENATVKLPFAPAFTAFEFYVSSQDEEIALTEFELVSPEKNDDYPGFVQDKLAGTFSMTAGDNSTVSASDAGSSIKVDLSSTDAIDATHGLSFTVFTVPVTNQSPLRIKFTSKDGENATKTSYLDLKYSKNEAAGANAGKAFQFQAGHKYRIHMLKLPSSQWRITITADFDEWVDAQEEVVIYI